MRNGAFSIPVFFIVVNYVFTVVFCTVFFWYFVGVLSCVGCCYYYYSVLVGAGEFSSSEGRGVMRSEKKKCAEIMRPFLRIKEKTEKEWDMGKHIYDRHSVFIQTRKIPNIKYILHKKCWKI